MGDTWWLWLPVGYFCGSIPFGLFIGKAHGIDVRTAGSGNIGATNVGRVLGKKWGGLCFVLDVLKGLLPVLIAGAATGLLGKTSIPSNQAWAWLGVAAATMAGHVFPVWLSFKGGKGVATGLGALLGFWPILTPPAFLAAVTWLILASTFRYVSLASILAALFVPLFLMVWAELADIPRAALQPFVVVSALMAVLVLLRHRSNIARLIDGSESRLGSRKA